MVRKDSGTGTLDVSKALIKSPANLSWSGEINVYANPLLPALILYYNSNQLVKSTIIINFNH